MRVEVGQCGCVEEAAGLNKQIYAKNLNKKSVSFSFFLHPPTTLTINNSPIPSGQTVC